MGVQNGLTAKRTVLRICPLGRKERHPKPSSSLSADSAGEVLSFAWFLYLCGVSGVTNSLGKTKKKKKKKGEGREKNS